MSQPQVRHNESPTPTATRRLRLVTKSLARITSSASSSAASSTTSSAVSSAATSIDMESADEFSAPPTRRLPRITTSSFRDRFHSRCRSEPHLQLYNGPDVSAESAETDSVSDLSSSKQSSSRETIAAMQALMKRSSLPDFSLTQSRTPADLPADSLPAPTCYDMAFLDMFARNWPSHLLHQLHTGVHNMLVYEQEANSRLQRKQISNARATTPTLSRPSSAHTLSSMRASNASTSSLNSAFRSSSCTNLSDHRLYASSPTPEPPASPTTPTHMDKEPAEDVLHSNLIDLAFRTVRQLQAHQLELFRLCARLHGQANGGPKALDFLEYHLDAMKEHFAIQRRAISAFDRSYFRSQQQL